jgi:hypothetical protein
VSRLSIAAERFLPLALALMFSWLVGCATPAVGDPCLPEQVPETGFDDREAYVESSSVQCETRVCIVYHLRGDPREGCTPVECAMGDMNCVPKACANQDDIENRVYCTCRCNSGNTGFAECECPDGFSCVDVLEQGGPGVRGGYCVKNNTSI